MDSETPPPLKPWLLELVWHTILLVVVVAALSYFTKITLLTYIVMAITSFWWSYAAKRNKILAGVVPSLISGLVPQIIYFYGNTTEKFSPSIITITIISNLVIVGIFSVIISQIASFIWHKRHPVVVKHTPYNP